MSTFQVPLSSSDQSNFRAAADASRKIHWKHFLFHQPKFPSDSLGCSGMLWDALGCSGMLWDVPGILDALRCPLKVLGMSAGILWGFLEDSWKILGRFLEDSWESANGIAKNRLGFTPALGLAGGDGIFFRDAPGCSEMLRDSSGFRRFFHLPTLKILKKS